jgi:hypothetical protein
LGRGPVLWRRIGGTRRSFTTEVVQDDAGYGCKLEMCGKIEGRHFSPYPQKHIYRELIETLVGQALLEDFVLIKAMGQ